MVASASQDGSGIFPAQQLTCQLGQDCHPFFDEALAHAVPRRTTAASSPTGEGEEYRVALGTASKIEVVTNVATYASRLTGSVGYSFCTDGSVSAPCPFYLGSFDALASNSFTPRLRCEDSSIVQVPITNLLIKLAQPAFGIAKSGSGQTTKGFPAGSLIFESSFDVGSKHYQVRRSSRSNVQLTADGTTFQANNITMTVDVPCKSGKVAVTVRITARDPGNGSAIGKPPVVSINTPSSVTCGAATTLAATATDPNGDLDDVRWYVDNVLLSPTTTTMVFTRQHTLRAVARDLRGAATTAKKVVSCL